MKDRNNIALSRGEEITLVKPVAEIERIINALLPGAQPIDTQKKDLPVKLMVDINDTTHFKVLLLLKGELHFYRTASESLLFATGNAPAVLGLLGTPFRFYTYSFVLSQGSEAYILPRELALDLTVENGLVREVLANHAWITDYQSLKGSMLINRTAYDVVCSLLCELAALPDERRLKTSVANYILERSNLARSGVMKILSDLRTGGYINIEYGKLQSIEKRFPKVY